MTHKLSDLKKEEDAPLVSVYMPTWNRGKRAAQAAQSVLDQTYSNIELIIVDDASKPETRLALEALVKADQRVQLVVNETNQGACYSRNVAINMAQGAFITGLDDDDSFLPERIALFMKHWQEEDAFLYADDIFDYGDHQKRITKKDVADLDRLLGYNCVGNQIFTKRQYLLDVGSFDNSLIATQDYDLWIRLTLAKKSGRRVPEATQIIARSETEDRISTSSKRWLGYWQTYQKHRSLMNRTQRKNRLFAIVMARGKHFGVRRALPLLTLSNTRTFIRWALEK